MTDLEQREAAKKFAADWKDKGYEKGECQPFWLSLLRNVYGIEQPEQFISFENQVHLDHTSFIDGSISTTKVLIEQKGLGKNLKKPIKQSDGSLLTPFQQAKRYVTELPVSMHPRWIVTCNFEEFNIYDMEHPSGEPEVILLKNLETEYYRLNFLVDTGDNNIKKEMEISLQAGELVGVLYDEILKEYKNPEDPMALKSLNMLCVRLVFCLYAEDAGIFGKRNKFHDYLSRFEIRDVREALIKLFKVLDTPLDKRDPYMDDDLAEFPYVNGGLFADENIIIPRFNEKIVNLLLNNASSDFDWNNISPTIFGAVFESTLNPVTRRSGGMHYTSIENIHKVIDPLFLDNLKSELISIKEILNEKIKRKKLEEFHQKLSSLTFLDPACGSGNFLTETYISLRRLENEVISLLLDGQVVIDAVIKPIKITIGQFYGIEINDFAETVAKTALWIAESQMMKETEDIVHANLDFLPLKSYANIIKGNALKMDWETLVNKDKLNYIIGNPPFIGARLMDHSQKLDMEHVFGKIKGLGNLDYVSAWYRKAAEFIKDTNIYVAFVSTNSITQGDQVSILWKPIMEAGITINFAYRTFKWNSEAKEKAAVHCVIIGFNHCTITHSKHLYINDSIVRKVDNINAYLVDAPLVFIESRKKPLENVPSMDFGSMPNDKGYLSNYTTEDKDTIIKKYPEAIKMFRKFVGAKEFLNNESRWCLWLENISPSQIKKIPPIYEAVQEVYKIRSNSTREATKKLAQIPHLFGEIRQPKGNYLLIPRHSSQNRRYIPIGYLDANTIAGDANILLPDATLYHFGVLISNVHMAWMRTVCGRIKSDYRYSNTLVYNNFPWCNPTDEQRMKIEQTAQNILNARALYPDCSLADLYNEVLMPPELRKAHRQNDKAVMQAYGFSVSDTTEASCVSKLMNMYQTLVKNL